jgi:hypothetical protein
MGDGDPGPFIQEQPATPRPIEAVATSATAFIGASTIPYPPRFVRSWSEYEGVGVAASALGVAVRGFFRNGGSSAWVAGVPRLDPAAVGDAVASADAEVALLAVVADPAPGVDVIEAAAVAADRRTMLLVEGPWPDAGAAPARAGGPFPAVGDARNVAVYWPRVRGDRGDGVIDTISPLGAVAGMIARTDATRGVFSAPAGSHAVLQGITGVSAAAGTSEADALSRTGINLIRTLPGDATVVWGARTQSPDPEWRYVPVRRMVLFLESSISRGLDWAVFEPNAEPLWHAVRRTVGAFLLQFFRDGAFAGRTPDESFFVRCDRETMTQEDLDRGHLVCVVGIAPVQPAEFLIFSIRIRTAGPPD